MLVHALGPVEADATNRWPTLARPPTAVVVAATRSAAGLAVVFCVHYRVYLFAQSGSDWGEQHVRITETTFGPAAEVVAERVLHADFERISESDTDGYDDAAGANAVVDQVLGNVARALIDEAYLETLVASDSPFAVLLRRAGAFADGFYEVDPDWDDGRGWARLVRAGIPADAALPLLELVAFLEMGQAGRELVARHPAATPEVLCTLAADPVEGVAARVAQRRGALDPAVQEPLLASGFVQVRAALAGADGLTPTVVRALARDGAEAVRLPLASRGALPEPVLFELVKDASAKVRAAVASDARLGGETLVALAGEPGEPVRAAVAANPSAPTAALTRITEHELSPRLRRMLAAHPNSAASVLEALFGADVGLRAQVAAHPALPASLARRCTGDAETEVREAVAHNRAVDASILESLIEDSSTSVREALAQNPGFPGLADLATDPSSAVRKAVAVRDDAPRDVLDALVNDSQSIVRDAALATIAAQTAGQVHR